MMTICFLGSGTITVDMTVLYLLLTIYAIVLETFTKKDIQ